MQGNDSYRLVVRRGPQPNQTFDLNKDISTVGRDITNDIVLNDPEVSRHHMRFTRGDAGFVLEDLGSTNGTFVNGQRLSGAVVLKNGDMIGMGETVTVSFEMARPPGAEELAAPTTAGPVPSQPPPAPAPVPSPPQDFAPRPPQVQPSPPREEQQPYYTPPAYSAPQAPPAAGYDYDPYAIREDEPSSNLRWLLIGCGGLALFCCCITVIGLVVIDTANLWCQVPILSDVMEALGQLTCG